MDEFNKTIEELNKKLDRIVDILERTDKRFEKYEPVLDSYCKLFDECKLTDDKTIKLLGRAVAKGLKELEDDLDRSEEAEEEESFEKYYECSLPDDNDDAKESDL